MMYINIQRIPDNKYYIQYLNYARPILSEFSVNATAFNIQYVDRIEDYDLMQFKDLWNSLQTIILEPCRLIICQYRYKLPVPVEILQVIEPKDIEMCFFYSMLRSKK